MLNFWTHPKISHFSFSLFTFSAQREASNAFVLDYNPKQRTLNSWITSKAFYIPYYCKSSHVNKINMYGRNAGQEGNIFQNSLKCNSYRHSMSEWITLSRWFNTNSFPSYSSQLQRAEAYTGLQRTDSSVPQPNVYLCVLPTEAIKCTLQQHQDQWTHNVTHGFFLTRVVFVLQVQKHRVGSICTAHTVAVSIQGPHLSLAGFWSDNHLLPPWWPMGRSKLWCISWFDHCWPFTLTMTQHSLSYIF